MLQTLKLHKKINTCIYVPPNAHILQYIQCILPNSDKSIFTLRLARTTLTMFLSKVTVAVETLRLKTSHPSHLVKRGNTQESNGTVIAHVIG